MNHILKEINSCIVEVSDIELQRKIWLNENNDTGKESSFDELICTLFDDFDINHFIKYEAMNYGLSEHVIKELKKLIDMLNGYILNNYKNKHSYEEIIEDKEWRKVSLQAKSVIEIWK